MNYIVYKTTNNINGKIYIGVSSNNYHHYKGSGLLIKKALKKYGAENFTKEILFSFDNKEDMLAKEKELVNEEFLLRDDTYNIIEGGTPLTTLNKVTVIDTESSTGYSLISKEEFNSGNYKAINSGTITVEDPNNLGQFIKVSSDEYAKGNYKRNTSNMVVVIDGDSTKMITSDEYAKGGYKTPTSGKIYVYKDKIDKPIFKHELEQYISEGWTRGRKPRIKPG